MNKTIGHAWNPAPRATLSILLLMGCSTVPQSFSPDNPLPPDTLSHETFTQTLAGNVKDGLVDYPQVAKDSDFTTYIHLLKHIAPQQLPAPHHQVALWINA